MSNVSGRADRSGSSRGFSAVEVMIALVVLSFLMIVGIRTFQGSRHMTRNATMKGNAQQNARNAVELATGDLRSLGFDLDVGGGQRGLVHAGPWDIIFNANILPANDDPMAPAFPRAIDVDLAGPGVPPGAPLYVPTSSFATGAETIRYTLDSNGDGVVSGADVGDDPEEATANPRDFVLLREVYGARGDGTNGGNGEPVALLRGPLADTDGTLPQPLLTYWLDDDDDPLTAEVLHGDADANGVLSQAEIAALTPVAPGDLALVSRVVLRVTTEDVESAGQTGPRGRSLMSSVSFRNPVRKTGIIAGTVFQDGDADQVYDPGSESPIPGVTVRLNTGQIFDTDVAGRYVFEVSAGTYTVTELDPPGFVSTTPNSYGVTLLTGSSIVYDFGDRPAMGVGTITGKVFHDIDTDGILNNGEPGLPSIVVTLHTGVSDTTDSDGVYAFAVPAGTFTVVETDSTGWTSTTPNAVEVILASDGDVAHLDFGDIPGSGLGTLKGVVFLDLDRDGLPGTVEPGVADSPVTVVSGSTVVDSTVTNGNGEYVFTLPQGNYDVEEWDRDGYSSTTPNVVRNVFIRPDSTEVVNFGDILDASLNFTVVTVGQTDRALSIVSTDLSEDNKGDSDIVLGTQLSAGSNNLHVWHNQRRNSGTPITALFEPSPSFSRNASHPIPVLHRLRINADSVDDVLTGLEATSSQNISMWITSTAGGSRGTLPTTPSAAYETSTGSSVLSLTPVTWPGTSTKGLLVGTQDGSGSGHVEVWLESGSLSYYHHNTADLHSGPSGGLGEIAALQVADFDQDGLPDIVVGEVLGTHQGRLTVFLGGSGGGGGFPWDWREGASYLVEGEVNALQAIDMREDDQNDVDLVVGTTRGTSSGVLELWLNEVVEGQALFGDPGTVGRVRSDWIDAGGEVLSLGVQPLDPDIFPDVVAGLRTSQYSGALSVFRAFGYLPSSGTEWSHSGSGEIVTVTVDDFNLDGLEDIAVGTRTALSTGELVVYFGQ